MMRAIGKLDRSVTVGIGVLVASLALLAVAVVSIFAALNSEGANLPEQGSLEQILNDSPGESQGGGVLQKADLGPLPPPPVRLGIPRLYVDAPIITMGFDAERYPQVPERPDQVAWYNFSAAPGQRSNAVMAGHVDWQTSTRQPIPGVFYRIRELEIGDIVTVTLEDGQKLNYRVTGNVATAYEDPNVLKTMDHTSKEVITLITCGGTWQHTGQGPFGGNYSHRVLVRAERIRPVAQAPANAGPSIAGQ